MDKVQATISRRISRCCTSIQPAPIVRGRVAPHQGRTSRLCWLLIPFVLLSGQLQAQQDITAQIWTRWQPEQRIAYLRGFYAGLKTDAAMFRQAEEDYPNRGTLEHDPISMEAYKQYRQEYYPPNLKFSFKGLQTLLDVFYTHPDNGRIPVPVAVRIVLLRAAGKTELSDSLLQLERRKSLKGK